MEVTMNPNPTPERFEDVYPRYEFAPLVRIALVLAGRIKRIIGSKYRRASKVTDHHAAGQTHVHWT